MTKTTTSESPAARNGSTDGSSAQAGPEGKRPKRGCLESTLGKKTSVETNRRAAVILEVLAGLRLPSEAAQALDISVTHYYVLERKALEGLLAACEPQPKGPPGPSAEQQVERLTRELEQCQRECQRQAALVRATQRAVGLPAAASQEAPKKGSSRRKGGNSGGKRRRRRRPTVRALRATAALAKNSSLSKGQNELQQSSATDPVGASRMGQQEP